MSASEARGDEVYQPPPEGEPGEAQPDMENALGEPDLDQTLDTGYSPPDRPLAATGYGTTAGEQRAGETLDQRLAQEEPEAGYAGTDLGSQAAPGDDLDGDGRSRGGGDMTGDPYGDESTAGRERAGRMAPAEEGPPVRHLSVLARDTGIDGGAASAEEAAVHVVEEEPWEESEEEP
ncbi:hypothetical protein BX286_0749 [Streptomyces sp. 3211.6]|uniref:DUF5709 domain-containing protein n=1 Tax=Streptomyces TaxID=1883 RepID=UPI0009A4965B|nr:MULTISPECIES: DUF5709 domain-containing protein [Streptomyces]RKT02838.1 hypothetical protein BX286_0749 [Streptomyces sp. 3211.6]RPF44162.1 hypothetical protein EDD96_0682 [Streptomyces sp. Ag109_G2-6]